MDYIGKNNFSDLTKNKDGWTVPSMSTRIVGHTLDELRMADYFNFKNNALTRSENKKVFAAMSCNLRKMRSSGNLILLKLPSLFFSLFAALLHESSIGSPDTQGKMFFLCEIETWQVLLL